MQSPPYENKHFHEENKMKKLYLTLTFAVVLMFVAAQNTHASPKCGWVGAACAHRGDVSNAPENTIPAFTSAVNNGAAQIELDVRLSSDNHMVIIHDSTVDRTTNGTGSVSSLTFAQLRALDAGSWFAPEFAGTQIPTLDEALNAIPQDIWVNVHIKGSSTGQMAAQLIQTKGRLDKCFLSCTTSEAAAARAAVPAIKICNMSGSRRPGTTYAAESIAMSANFVQFKYDLYSEALKSDTKLLHDAGIAVNYYYADSDSQFEAIIQAGVDYPLTNNLTQCVAYFNQYSVPQIYGDCDCDNDVDFDDFAILVSYWLELWPIGDFASADGEGFPDSEINNYDLLVFSSHWFETVE